MGKIRTESLKPKILDLVNNPAYKDKAGQVASQMAREEFTEELYRAIISA